MKIVIVIMCLLGTTGLLGKSKKWRKKKPPKPTVTVDVSAQCCNYPEYPQKNMENGCEDDALKAALRAQGKKLGNMKLIQVTCKKSNISCIHDDEKGVMRICSGKVGK